MANFECTPVHDIMVWGGVHGKRRMLRGRFGGHRRGEGGPGVPLVKSLQKVPLRTANGLVEAGIANPEAVSRGIRSVDANLALCLANPEVDEDTYEGRLVPGILLQSRDRDLVLDIHEQFGIADTDYAYVGPRVYPHVLGFAKQAGITTVMVTDFGIQNILPQAMLVDLSKNSKRDVAYWRSQLETTLQEGLPSPSVEEFTIFAVADLTASEHVKLGVNGRKFKPLVDEVPGASELLGVDRLVYALYEPGYEVVSQLTSDDLRGINSDDGSLRLPTLRSLAH